jgi:predicted alpha/beta superfamily hydrolase
MEYQLYIGLPEDYDSSSESYPVVYFLDAWAQFGIIKQTYFLLRFYDEVPPLLLVGIAFRGGVHELLYNRSRDYTPTYVPKENIGPAAGITPISGGASNFTRFLDEELFPMIQSEYREDKSDRAIFGVSYGGLFTTYALFCYTNLFQRYLLGNPSFWWDDEIIFKYEEEYAKKHKSLNAKVFTAVGSEEGEEDIKKWTQFCDRLKSRNYEGLELKSMILEGETHMASYPAMYSKALRFLYSQ